MIVFSQALYMYYVHSYAVSNVPSKFITHSATYQDTRFISAVEFANIIGYQFHPERSGQDGLTTLIQAILRLNSRHNKIKSS